MPKFTNQIRTCTPTTLEYSFSCALEKLEHKYRVEGGRKSWNRCNKRRRDKWKEREKEKEDTRLDEVKTVNTFCLESLRE